MINKNDKDKFEEVQTNQHRESIFMQVDCADLLLGSNFPLQDRRGRGYRTLDSWKVD